MRDMAEKRPGRPRDPSVEKAVLRATVQRLVSDGYSRMTIGDIAADAGVTRPTVYRRWSNKHDLVVDALDFNFQEERERHPVGPLEELPPVEALRQALRHASPFGPAGRGMTVVGNVLSEAERTPGLIELVRKHALEPRQKPLIDTLRRLAAQGVLREGVDAELTADMMIGSYYASYMRQGERDPELEGRVVEMVWRLVRAEG